MSEALINPSLHKEVQRVLDTYRDVTAQIIRKAQAQEQLDPALDPLAFSNALISLYYGLELQLALDPEIDVQPYTDVVRAFLKSASYPC